MQRITVNNNGTQHKAMPVEGIQVEVPAPFNKYIWCVHQMLTWDRANERFDFAQSWVMSEMSTGLRIPGRGSKSPEHARIAGIRRLRKEGMFRLEQAVARYFDSIKFNAA